MQETARTRVGLRCSGYREKRRSMCVIVAAGIGVLLCLGDSRTLAEEGPCGGFCVLPDCNTNWLADSCDVDCDNTGYFCIGGDQCFDLDCNLSPDCGESNDCNSNGVPDECDPDCDGNGLPDDCESTVACCLTDDCLDLDPDCCTTQGGTSRGPGTSCGSDIACCLATECWDADQGCCDDEGGVSAGAGSVCSSGICADEGLACCKGDDVDETSFVPWCGNHSLYDCVDHGGTPLSTTLGCSALLLIADADGDDVIDDCDNCVSDQNLDQSDSDECVGGADEGDECEVDADCTGGACAGDGVGDVCDNCEHKLNASQDNSDADGFGDACDNCVPYTNPLQLDCNSNGIGDVCDVTDETSLDCNSNGIPDECDIVTGVLSDCDGDGIPDICPEEDDIDDDGVLNDDDLCDYSPSTLTVDDSGPFIGTVREDLDGDCDVDGADRDLVLARMGDSTCDPFNGVPSEEPLCDNCAACNSCCFWFPR